MRARRLAVVAGLLAVAGVATTMASATPAQREPITIGWAYDTTGTMAVFDTSAVASAKLHLKTINAKGGALGRRIVLETCDTQGNKAAVAKSCAARPIAGAADVIFTTLRRAARGARRPGGDQLGVLAVAACIGTDQMGPKRFGRKGRPRVHVRQPRPGRGLRDGRVRVEARMARAAIATDTIIDYFKNVNQAFEARWRQLGGVVAEESYVSSFDGNADPASWQNVVNRLKDVDWT